MPTPRARERTVRLCLDLVVKLLGEPLADLLRHRLRVHAGRERLRQPQEQAQVLHVGAHGARDAGVLHLDGDAAAVVQPRAVDLADGCGGKRLGLELRERVVELLARVGLDHLAHLIERDPRGRVAQLGELGLEPLVGLLGEGTRVHERGNLADLHRRALHLAEDVQDSLGRLQLPPLGRGAALLLGAGQVCGTARVRARRLAAGQPAEAGGAADPAGRDRVVAPGHATDGTGRSTRFGSLGHRGRGASASARRGCPAHRLQLCLER